MKNIFTFTSTLLCCFLALSSLAQNYAPFIVYPNKSWTAHSHKKHLSNEIKSILKSKTPPKGLHTQFAGGWEGMIRYHFKGAGVVTWEEWQIAVDNTTPISFPQGTTFKTTGVQYRDGAYGDVFPTKRRAPRKKGEKAGKNIKVTGNEGGLRFKNGYVISDMCFQPIMEIQMPVILSEEKEPEIRPVVIVEDDPEPVVKEVPVVIPAKEVPVSEPVKTAAPTTQGTTIINNYSTAPTAAGRSFAAETTSYTTVREFIQSDAVDQEEHRNTMALLEGNRKVTEAKLAAEARAYSCSGGCNYKIERYVDVPQQTTPSCTRSCGGTCYKCRHASGGTSGRNITHASHGNTTHTHQHSSGGRSIGKILVGAGLTLTAVVIGSRLRLFRANGTLVPANQYPGINTFASTQFGYPT